MPYRSKCVRCDQPAAVNWSIFDGETAVIAALCEEHSSCLRDLVELVGPKPSPATGEIQQVRRAPKARPLNWTPPT